MPVYIFSCPSCGPFEVSRPMAEVGSGACCPVCHSDARRIFTPPGITRLAPPLRRALDAEEASAHEPRLVTKKRGRPIQQRRSAAPP